MYLSTFHNQLPASLLCEKYILTAKQEKPMRPFLFYGFQLFQHSNIDKATCICITITLHVFDFQDEDIPGNYNLFNKEAKSDRNGEVIFASIYYHNG